MASLSDNVVVITGASRGIGEALAVGFAAQGAELVLAARSTDDLDRVHKACIEAGAAGATILPTDVTNEDDVRRLVDETVAARGKIDVFVANAGTSYGMLTEKRYRELWTYDLDIVDQVLTVNAIGTWLCIRHAIPVMTKGSSFILIGSETGRVLSPGSGIYAISKATQEAMATMAAKEAEEQGVRINILSPGGMVDTQLFGPNGMPEFLKQMHPPLPADIVVPPALWLASPESIGVTGARLTGRTWATKTPAEWKSQFQTAGE